MKKILLILAIFFAAFSVKAQKFNYINQDLKFEKLGQLTTPLDSFAFFDSNLVIKRVNYSDVFAKLLNDITISFDYSNLVVDVTANTAKDTNVTTDLSFSRTATTLTVLSSDGTDAILPESDTTNSGLLGADKWDEIVANTLKVTDLVHPLVETAVPVGALFTDTVYTHPNHTGEITSTGDGATVIISGVVDVDNLVTALKATAASTTGTVDFDLGIIFPVPMTANTTLTFSNYYEGKVITLKVTGNYTLTLPTEVKGDLSAFDGTLTNIIDIRCIDAATPVFTAQIVNY